MNIRFLDVQPFFLNSRFPSEKSLLFVANLTKTILISNCAELLLRRLLFKTQFLGPLYGSKNSVKPPDILYKQNASTSYNWLKQPTFRN